MQKLTVDELKRLLYDTFRDHLTMKDIENIIMTEENHLNSPESHMDIDSEFHLRLSTHHWLCKPTSSLMFGQMCPQPVQRSRRNTHACAKVWFVPSLLRSSSALCSSQPIKCSAEEWSEKRYGLNTRQPEPKHVTVGVFEHRSSWLKM